MPKRDAFDLSSGDEQEDAEEQGSEQQNDSDDSGERPSPSQYRKERAEQEDAEESQDEESSEEEEDFDEDELEVHSTSNLSATPGAANQDMTSQFAELSRMFAAVCEQNRKLQLATSQMARRTARQSLDF